MATNGTLLDVNDLRTYFYTKKGVVKAVNGVSYTINRGESLGLVGESGCGKSVSALSLMRLIPSPPGKIESGVVEFDGIELIGPNQISLSEMRAIRGNRISMIFQDPMTSLNPVLTVGEQVAETIDLHQKLTKHEVLEKVIDYFGMVGLPNPRNRVENYPHQLSGGMRQRVGIAMALSCNPSLLIADEPTTALDVTIQAQILEIMSRLMDEIQTSLILITHNLGLVVELSSKVAVMYAGRISEFGKVEQIFESPKHPYTIGLHASIPKITEKRERLMPIPGDVPDLINPPSGCPFHPRCSKAMTKCRESYPNTVEIEPGHYVSCHLYS
ncbi:peptide ABC transporter ATP-binding protein [Candidatus Heimdallarchaeota archaeon B3_Heim]|nr:MAG: peptide ABC transporter ATP-binding protein [Candidatus Heimdallarchaeota archaeon B3_Heim]